MALPSISNRPEKTISGFDSKWNAASLPIEYTIDNTKFPINTDDLTDTVATVSDNNGFAQLDLSTANETYLAGEYIELTGFSVIEDGVYKIKSVSGNDPTLFISFTATDSGTIQRYYQNYTLLIRVYAGIPAGHPLNAKNPIELVTTLEQVPTSNSQRVDIADIVRAELQTENLINEYVAVDWNLWSAFYIEFAERYDDENGENSTSSFTSDSSNTLYASHSARQFQDQRAGNMYENVSRPFGGDFLTNFEEPTLFEGKFYDISILADNAPAIISVSEYDSNNNLINSFEISLQYFNEDEGLYRFPLSTSLLMDETERIEIILE